MSWGGKARRVALLVQVQQVYNGQVHKAQAQSHLVLLLDVQRAHRQLGVEDPLVSVPAAVGVSLLEGVRHLAENGSITSGAR